MLDDDDMVCSKIGMRARYEKYFKILSSRREGNRYQNILKYHPQVHIQELAQIKQEHADDV